jgi:hypothetical protein
VEADRERLAHPPGHRADHVAGVGVHTGHTEDGDRDAGLLGDFALQRADDGVAHVDLTAGEFPVSLSRRRTSNNQPRSSRTAAKTDGATSSAGGAPGSWKNSSRDTMPRIHDNAP